MKADVKMVILDESVQLRSTIELPHALIQKSINLVVLNTGGIVMKLAKNLSVLLLTKQTNVWVCSTEKVLFRDRRPSNLSNIN